MRRRDCGLWQGYAGRLWHFEGLVKDGLARRLAGRIGLLDRSARGSGGDGGGVAAEGGAGGQ